MKKFYLVFVCTLAFLSLRAQILQGNAIAVAPSLPGSSDYQLTADGTFQRGAFWKNTAVDLSSSFIVSADLYFGTQTGTTTYPGSHETSTGADGIAFVLQSSGTGALGDVGEGQGYGGLNNSFAVEMDTWQNDEFGPNPINRFDPAQDHIAFMKNGDATHNTAANSNANLHLLPDLENGNWHSFTASWSALTQTLSVSLDGNTYSFTGNLASIIANGGPVTNMVNWGFTAATGAAVNVHKIRFAAPCTPFSVYASVPALGCSNGNVIYIGYGQQSVTAVASPSSAAITFTWYKVGPPDVMVATGAQFTPTEAGQYYVVGTNGSCMASTMNTLIRVYDIRCGNNKVYVCHKENGVNGVGTIGDNAHTLCISINAVPAHLAHGCCLGSCEMNRELISGSGLVGGTVVYPNPTYGEILVRAPLPKNITSEIIVRNPQGRIIERKLVSGGSVSKFQLRKSGIGIFLVQIITQENIQTHKVLVQ